MPIISSGTSTPSINPQYGLNVAPAKQQQTSALTQLHNVRNTPCELPAKSTTKTQKTVSLAGVNPKQSNHLPYPKIKQFSDINDVLQTHYKNKVPPTLTFHGTVKLHGTNGSVAHDYVTGEQWPQSRNQILGNGAADNKGFAAYTHREDVRPLFQELFHSIDKFRAAEEKQAVIYGEWCGKGIQKGVAISQLSPRFVVFDIGLYNSDGDCRFLSHDDVHNIIITGRGQEEFSPGLPILSSKDFKTWAVTIDFNNRESCQDACNFIKEVTKTVNEACPVGEQFGKNGVGEGIVWACEKPEKDIPGKDNILRFKSKGETLSETHGGHNIPLAPQETKEKDLVDASLTENRLNNVFDNLPDGKRDLKTFLQAIKRDVLTEEALTITHNKLNKKLLATLIEQKAKSWFP